MQTYHPHQTYALFLYGPGMQCIQHRMKQLSHSVQPAEIAGRLFLFPGNVPAAIQGSGTVYGKVLLTRHFHIFNQAVKIIQEQIQRADDKVPIHLYKPAQTIARIQLERYHALAYMFTNQQYATQHGTPIPSGRWPQNSSSRTRRVYVDADACPKDVLHTVMQHESVYSYELVTIASYHHHIESPHHIVVDDGPDAADHAIVNRCQPGDVVVTQDWGLASLILAKQSHAISPKGTVYDPQRIDFLLAERFVKAKARLAGKRTRGPKARTHEDQSRFQRVFCHLMDTLNT